MRLREFIMIAVPILVLVGMAALLAFLDDIQVHPQDYYCPTGTWAQNVKDIRSPGHTAILIDTSDEIRWDDVEPAIQSIETWARDAVPFLQRLHFYGLPESDDGKPNPVGEPFCVPKEGPDANLIYENRVFVEAEFQRFLAGLKPILEQLIGRPEAEYSPIVETMADLVELHDELDSFVLVSDMLQNTHVWNHYNMQGDAAAVASVCGRITGSGRVKNIYVYYIDRQRKDGIQAPEWPDAWWQNCLGGAEAVTLNRAG